MFEIQSDDRIMAQRAETAEPLSGDHYSADNWIRRCVLRSVVIRRAGCH